LEEFMAQRKQWRDLSPVQRASVFVLVSIQVSLLVAALADLRRRPAAAVRGPKPVWGAVAFINYIGPLAYFVFGRKQAVSPQPGV
jgi:hypothetical protein